MKDNNNNNNEKKKVMLMGAPEELVGNGMSVVIESNRIELNRMDVMDIDGQIACRDNQTKEGKKESS